MPNETPSILDSGCQAKKKTQRHLARQLIQHIITLYDSIIQKIQHGIGLLWEEYFSKELFHIAKLRVEHQLINDITQLNDWFDKISLDLRDKVTNLSASLLSHFNQIIKAEVDFLNNPVDHGPTFDEQRELSQKDAQKFDDPYSENKLNHSLYETCTESSRGQRKKRTHQRLETVSSQSVCSQSVSIECLEDENFVLDTDVKFNSQFLPQLQAKTNLENSYIRKFKPQQTPKRLRKISENNDSSDCQEQGQGGFYEVFLGIMDAFEL